MLDKVSAERLAKEKKMTKEKSSPQKITDKMTAMDPDALWKRALVKVFDEKKSPSDKERVGG